MLVRPAHWQEQQQNRGSKIRVPSWQSETTTSERIHAITHGFQALWQKIMGHNASQDGAHWKFFIILYKWFWIIYEIYSSLIFFNRDPSRRSHHKIKIWEFHNFLLTDIHCMAIYYNLSYLQPHVEKEV